MDIVGYDILEDGGLRYAWKDARFKKCIESAAFINRSKGKLEDICGFYIAIYRNCICQENYYCFEKSEKCILQFGRRVKKNRKFNLTAKKQYFNEPRIRKCKKNY